MPDTSILDARLAALAATDPTPAPEPTPEPTGPSAPPAWKFGCHFWPQPADAPTVTFACSAPADPDRTARASADGPEKLAAEVLDAAKKLPALGKVADFAGRIAAVNDRMAAARRARQTAEARETIIKNDPPPQGLADALRAADDARQAANRAMADAMDEMRVLEPHQERHRGEIVTAMGRLADEAARRLRADVAAEEERLLAEVEAFAIERAGRVVHLKAVAALLDSNAEFRAAKAAERAILGEKSA